MLKSDEPENTLALFVGMYNTINHFSKKAYVLFEFVVVISSLE
jgi:hypothetical protein